MYDHGDVVRQSLKDEKWEFIAEVCPWGHVVCNYLCSLAPL